MTELCVLLDSCVMFPMYLRDTLLCAAEAGIYLPFWSQEILDGATRNLAATNRMTIERARRLEAQIKQVFPEAMVEVPDGLAEVMTNPPGDCHVLAAAVTGKVDVIVTSNLKHFQAKDLAPWNIKAYSPDDFLNYLYDLYPENMVQVVRRQSAVFQKPPLSLVELLERLNKEVPEFVSNVLFHEYSYDVMQTAKKASNLLGMTAPEGGQCYQGKKYRLWQQRGILTVNATDRRGEILRFQNGQIEGNLLSEDVKAFQIFGRSLEQELVQVRGSSFRE